MLDKNQFNSKYSNMKVNLFTSQLSYTDHVILCQLKAGAQYDISAMLNEAENTYDGWYAIAISQLTKILAGINIRKMTYIVVGT